MTETATRRVRLPKGIWMLGLVSLFMDISSEMIHAVLPLFLAAGLGASAFAIGLIDGLAEATAMIVKVFSGALSDWIGRRKGLAVLGYGLGAASKPLFAIAPSVGVVLSARLIDRLGKGIRGAPRDALIADIAPPELRGAAYGLRQALDTVGAFAGPLAAIGLMLMFANDFRMVFWVAIFPGALAVALLAFGVSEPRRSEAHIRRNPITRENMRQLGGAFWRVTAVGAVFMLARFSEAFLVLRANSVGMTLAFVPIVMVLMNAVFSLAAYPFGRLSDQVSPARILGWGLGVLIGADVVLAFGTNWTAVLAGAAIWGLHMGMTQGLLSALVAGAAPTHLRGTAFGVFNLVSGVMALFASLLAGLVWDGLGPAATFLAGALFAVVAMTMLPMLGRR